MVINLDPRVQILRYFGGFGRAEEYFRKPVHMSEWSEDNAVAVHSLQIMPMSPPSPSFFGINDGSYTINDDPEPFDDLDKALNGLDEEENASSVDMEGSESKSDGNVIDMDTWDLSSDGEDEDPTSADRKRKKYVVDEASEAEDEACSPMHADSPVQMLRATKADLFKNPEQPKDVGIADVAAVGSGQNDVSAGIADVATGNIDNQLQEIIQRHEEQKARVQSIERTINWLEANPAVVLACKEISLTDILKERKKTIKDIPLAYQPRKKSLSVVVPNPPPGWVKGKTTGEGGKGEEGNAFSTLMANATGTDACKEGTDSSRKKART
tara:strand:+ start:29602 stop:30579 length:978 start_codon:yes stop_codon:yes gene_type:complete